MIIYKYRCIENVLDNKTPILGYFGDSSYTTKWSKNAGTIYLDKPSSIKALKRMASMADRYDNTPNIEECFPQVKTEIVKFELREIK